MRVQFVFGTDIKNTIDIDVADVPTKEEAEAIENEVYNTMNAYEEEHGNFIEFDFYMCCYNAVQKHIHTAENRVVKTIYIDYIEEGY